MQSLCHAEPKGAPNNLLHARDPALEVNLFNSRIDHRPLAGKEQRLAIGFTLHLELRCGRGILAPAARNWLSNERINVA
jgi:hypothetical protein